MARLEEEEKLLFLHSQVYNERAFNGFSLHFTVYAYLIAFAYVCVKHIIFQSSPLCKAKKMSFFYISIFIYIKSLHIVIFFGAKLIFLLIQWLHNYIPIHEHQSCKKYLATIQTFFYMQVKTASLDFLCENYNFLIFITGKLNFCGENFLIYQIVYEALNSQVLLIYMF